MFQANLQEYLKYESCVYLKERFYFKRHLMELKQFDTNLDSFKYIIEETGIRLIKRRIATSSDTFVEFEDIGSKIIKEKSRKLVWLFISILFLIIAITVFVNRLTGGNVGRGAEVFHLTVSSIFFVIFLLTKKNILFLAQADNTNAIEFIGTKKYKNQVDEFIKELLQQRDKFLIEKYSTLDEFLPYNQQYNNLVWLYNLKLLTKPQLQAKITELDKIDFNNDNSKKNNLVKIVGFRNNNFKENEEDFEKGNDM